MNNLQIALDFGIRLIGVPYDYWLGGDNQKDAPMFAYNGEVPNIKDVTSVNCAGLCNLILRSIGKELPFSKKTKTIGGTVAYFEYYQNKSYEFSIKHRYPLGTLLMRNYRSMNDQGHLAITLNEKGTKSLILQSNVDGEFFKSTKPGVNAIYTLEESNMTLTDENGNGCYYDRIVLPEDWIE